MNIILPDGSVRDIPAHSTAFDLAKSISIGLSKEALAARINGTVSSIQTELFENDTVSIITFASPEGKSVYWHSASHILAQAVQELFPTVKLAIGPAIENGFYYDFDSEKPFTPDDFIAIEKKCTEIAKRDLPIVKSIVSQSQALSYYTTKGEIYKAELIAELVGEISMYAQGDWQDLCRGPHVTRTSVIKTVKILSLAGAYWRGSEKNKMLQRIYGIAFPKQADLDAYLTMLEEAAKRDHRKLGKELDLFSFHAEGTGFPFWHPNGMLLYNTIMDFCRREHLAAGYQEIKTPIILNEELWHRSGHWDKYRDNMYFTTIDETVHAVKPMNCPGGLLVYNSSAHSYREFPLKFCEFGLVHRHEKAGVLHGLFRVRQFTQDDAHIFCLLSQIEDQIAEVIAFITRIYATFGFNDYKIELSTRPEKYIGSLDVWAQAEKALQNVLESQKIQYQLNPGDGAFYGPKIDFHVKDSIGRTWQCGTIQLDFAMPERFELEYADADGTKKRPVMIHRALLGSMERFIGILIENYGGALPVWLSPVQVRILPIADRFIGYANTVKNALQKAGIRADIDSRSEKIGYKIRSAETQKVPFMAIIGEKEESINTVSVRRHGLGDVGSESLLAFVSRVMDQISTCA